LQQKQGGALVYKITVFLAILLLTFGSNISASSASISITDFTLHKVAPVQDNTSSAPAFNPTVPEKKQPEKEINYVKDTKPVQEVVKKPVEVTVEKPAEKVAEKIAEKPEKEFNKQNYVENLNNHLKENELSKTNSQNTEKTNSKTYNHFDYVVRPFLSLAIVLVLMFIFAWLYNKLRGINPNALFSGKFSDMDVNKFTVLASSSLGQGKIIHLVEINGKQLVVGSTNNNISLLTEIRPEDMENLMAKANKNYKHDKNIEPEEADEFENVEPESYSAKYSNVYKDYVE